MTHSHATGAGRPGQLAPLRSRAADAHDDAERGVGWLIFAAIVIALAGVLNVIYGIAAIGGSDFYVQDVEYVLGGLETFGWIMLVVGIVQFCAALGILAFTQWGRWVGVAAAAANAIVHVLIMPAAPFLCLAIFAVDVVVIYGLAAYGGRWREP